MPAVQRSFRIRAYPNAAQQRMLSQWFGSARWLWNWALDMHTKAYKRRGEFLNSISIGRRLTKLKQIERFAWLQRCPATTLTQTLRDQDAAFANFFRRIKAGERRGYPKFRNRSMAASLRFQGVGVAKWTRGVASLPKLGRIKLAEKLPTVACPDTVTLKRGADGHYYISFRATVEIALLPVVNRMIGVDLGITHLAILSNGEKVENPRRLKAHLRYLKQQQRCLSRRQNGSKRREKQRLRVARAHAQVREQRNYAAHQLTTKLVRNFDVVCVEDLKVKNMIKNPRLAHSIADAGWGEIRRQLEYKCAWYGRTLLVVDQWFPSSKTCSKCNHKLDELRLDVREWECPRCGSVHDRDINGAINVLAAGMRQLAGREDRNLPVDGTNTALAMAAIGNSETGPDETGSRRLISECLRHPQVS